LEDLDEEGRILRSILKKQVIRVWTGLIWLRIILKLILEEGS
jgi:hypothetical protein